MSAESSSSLAELLREGTTALKAAGVPLPRQTASLLIRETLGLDTAKLIARPETSVSQADAVRVREAFVRRSRGEPLQYITGRQEFYGLDFHVTPAVLIPRPETELLIEIALEFCRGTAVESPVVVDVGTGSGCLAVTLAVHLPKAEVTALDISPAALAVARENALRLGVADRIRFVESDYLETLLREGTTRADVVVSNPPYVSVGEYSELQREVRDFEPRTALVGGPEGTEGYARLFGQLGGVLKPDGIFACEVGFTQSDRVAELGLQAGWTCLRVVQDLQGIPRALVFGHR